MQKVQAGKLRTGSVFETMKNCRKLFVNAMKFVKKNKQKIEDDALAWKYKERNSKEFWKTVNKRRGAEVRVDAIDGQRNNDEIVKIFAEKFSKITRENNRIYDTDIFSPNVNFTSRVSSSCVRRAINKLNTVVGFDGLHSK